MEDVNNGTLTTMPIPDAGHMNKHGRFEQIQAVQTNPHNGEHALYALDTKGVVWEYLIGVVGGTRWVPLVMTRGER